MQTEPPPALKAEPSKPRCGRDCHVLELLSTHPLLSGPEIAAMARAPRKSMDVTLEKLEAQHLLWRVRDSKRGQGPAMWALREHKAREAQFVEEVEHSAPELPREAKSPTRESQNGSSMVDRFHRERWTPTRLAMDSMEPGETLTPPMSEYYSVKATAERLSDAYTDRGWKVTRRAGELTVRCHDKQQPF
jgi:hypothetical protein